MHARLEKYARTFADRLIEALKGGVAPWQKPWKPGELSWPANATTGHRYRGNNAVLLLATALTRGYGDMRWAGFGQIRRAGGMVRKGEKGTPILVWRERTGTAASGAEDTDNEEDRPRFFATVHNVFNVTQADGLDLDDPAAEAPPCEPHAAVRRVAGDAHVRIVHMRGDRACYSPSADAITMPERSQFSVPSAYEHTLLHELAHCTSHPSRLDRPCHGATDRGTAEYALEELRAEIAALMLGERLHVGHEPRHGHAYVASWIRALDDDPNAVRKAAADSERIADWLTRNIPAAETPAAAPLAA